MDWPGFIGLRWELGMALVVSAVGWGGGVVGKDSLQGGGGVLAWSTNNPRSFCIFMK